MAKKRAKAPWTAEALEVFPYRTTGILCLVVQSNADRDAHSSELDVCEDFSTEDPNTVWTLKSWVYSMALGQDETIYLAHSGKTLRHGPVEDPAVVLTHDHDVTRLCGAREGVYLVGLGGYVGHFDGKRLRDLPVPDADVFHVTESADGTLYAAGSHGRVFRRSGTEWIGTKVGDGADVRHVTAIGAHGVLFAGAEGVCGRLDGDVVTRFEAPRDRDFFAIAEFQDRVFVGAGRLGLDVVEADAVVSFKGNVFSFKLHASALHLYASGSSQAARFDGEAWLATEFTPA